MSSDRAPATRYVFIDALRGIAALGVLFHHLLHNSALEPALRAILPRALQSLCTFGARGVQVFFVISGFVIAHSLRDVVPSARSVGNFALRRQARLDPVYWTTIAVALAVWGIERAMPSFATPPLPGAPDVAANMFYFQNILQRPSVVGVAWTLCIEIQFYLVFMGILWLTFAISGTRFEKLPAAAAWPVFLLGVASLYGSQGTMESPFFTPFWSFFAAGALCYWVLTASVSRWLVAAYLSAMLAVAILRGIDGLYVGTATAAMLVALGLSGGLTRCSCGGVIQYFGRISYSLYIIHLTVAVAVLRLGYKVTGDRPVYALLWAVAAGAASIVSAHLLYVLVERPSMRLSSWLKASPRRREGAASQVVAESPVEGERRLASAIQ